MGKEGGQEEAAQSSGIYDFRIGFFGLANTSLQPGCSHFGFSAQWSPRSHRTHSQSHFGAGNIFPGFCFIVGVLVKPPSYSTQQMIHPRLRQLWAEGKNQTAMDGLAGEIYRVLWQTF